MKARGDGSPTLGIIAGAGTLPLHVAQRARTAGRDVFILGFHDLADPGIDAFAHAWVRWGQIGRMLRLLRRHGCGDLVIIGSVRRPKLTSLRVDAGLIRHAPEIYRLTRGGDDAVLTRVVRFFEAQGFRVRGAHEIAGDLTAPAGTLTRTQARPEDHRDIEKALAILNALGPHDVGQAAVVARGYALAIEAAEGTDEMLRRCAGLRQWGLSYRHGVVLKMPKPGQELRVDMPAVGPRTVELASDAGLSGLALAQGHVLLVEPQQLIATADRLGLFVLGIETAQSEAVWSAQARDNAYPDGAK
jgi:UDP-2,3-diacylglucosamine hydrolase